MIHSSEFTFIQCPSCLEAEDKHKQQLCVLCLRTGECSKWPRVCCAKAPGPGLSCRFCFSLFYSLVFFFFLFLCIMHVHSVKDCSVLGVVMVHGGTACACDVPETVISGTVISYSIANSIIATALEDCNYSFHFYHHFVS